MKIAIDAMGGDFAPEEIVLGAISAVKDYPQTDIVLVGDESQIKAVLENNGEVPSEVSDTPVSEEPAMAEELTKEETHSDKTSTNGKPQSKVKK